MKNVAVFFGGRSCEHDISVITGVLTLNSINGELFNAIPVYISGDGKWYTGKSLNDVAFYKNVDYKKLTQVTVVSGVNALFAVKGDKIKKTAVLSAAVNCLHGLNGEDGTLVGVMKLCFIPLVGADVFAAALSIDKDFTKIALNGLNIDNLPYLRIYKRTFYAKTDLAVKLVEKKFKYPVIVKPSRLGSSIGVYKCDDGAQLVNNLRLSFRYDDKIIVEPYVENLKEINCACYKFNDEIIVSECEEPIKESDVLSFYDKYGCGTGMEGAAKNFPAKISKERSDKIKELTKKIYRKCDFSGVIRVDYILSGNKIYVNEINSAPGSMAYYLFTDTLSGFGKLLTDLINESIKVSLNYNNNEFTFNSNVLNVNGVKGGKTKFVDKKRT